MDGTGAFKTMDANIVCLIILIFLYFKNSGKSEKTLFSYKFFSSLILTNIALIIIDFLSWSFNGYPGAVNTVLNTIFNLLLYITGPVAPVLWMLYLHDLIFGDKKLVINVMRALMIPLVINTVIACASLTNGWYFYIDAANVYHRGSLYFLHPALCGAFIAHSMLMVVMNKKRIEKRNYLPLLLFFIPPFVGAIIQVFFYGYTLTWVGMAFSVLVVYCSIQDKDLNTDQLTGAFNRRQFEMYIGAKGKPGADRTFSAISLDFDGLKLINDTLGHAAGDEALVESVNIIKKSIRKNDMVIRTGGDEFIVILDIALAEALEHAKKRILRGFEEYNIFSGKPYKISFSIGSGICGPGPETKVKDFFSEVDMHMYKDKASKCRQSPSEA